MEKQTFYYSTSTGKSGTSAVRLKSVQTEVNSAMLALQLEQLTAEPATEMVVEGESGAKISVASIRCSGGMWGSDFRYAVIYEGVRPQSYAVFYASKCGEVTWIAGPKSVSFDKVWREFRAGLQ